MFLDDLPSTGFIRATFDLKHSVCQSWETASGVGVDTALRKKNVSEEGKKPKNR